MKVKHLLSTLFSVFTLAAFAQQALPLPGSAEYSKMKSEGKIPATYNPFMGNVGGQNILQPTIQSGNFSPQGGPSCVCLQNIDNTFQVAPFTNGFAPDYRNDDGSTPEIQLPFDFCLYGTNYNSMWINTNGNITFTGGYTPFSSVGFPNTNNVMVAPFWADVDLNNPASGLVYYKVTPTHAIIRWQNVGYYSSQADKINDFQLIITNGSDPIIPIGTNASFCYGDMQWTTGSASGGSGGFGGTPANVGANRGNGTDYIQFGRFDAAGIAYDGPFGNNDGISWLDNKSFYFNACVGTSNTPPVLTGINVCDSISNICVGDVIPLNFSFFSLEPNEIISTVVNVTNVPGLTGSATTGITSDVTSTFAPTAPGTYTLVYTASDNATPPGSLTISFVITVNDYPVVPLTLTDSIICPGEQTYLIAPSGFTSYVWNPSGPDNDTLTITAGGSYFATISDGFCPTTTDTFTVLGGNPIPVINGAVPFCSNDCITLTSDSSQNFTQLLWSTGDTTASITVCDSALITLVLFDQYGCTDSTFVYLTEIPAPTAAFTTNPPSPALLLEPVTITDQSTTTTPGDSIVSWQWAFPNALPSSSNTPNNTISYSNVSDSTITLIVTNTYGCTDTLTLDFDAVPANVPNVFTPNGDGFNDFFIVPKASILPNCQLFIYSRWGKLVYKSDNYKNDWDGESHSDGVYYFVVLEPDGTESHGTVTILRNK